MRHFFISGLPRSRTAWLSNLFTTGTSFCDHDALKAGFNVDTLERRFSKLAACPSLTAVGDSDSGLLFLAEQVEARWPGAPWLLVKRDRSAAEASFNRAFAVCNPYGHATPEQIKQSFDACEAAYSRAKSVLTNYREVDFEQLECPDAWQAAFELLLPGQHYCKERAAMLNTFSIEIVPEKVHCV